MSHQDCKTLYYVDLFSGQGYFDDGNRSTPLMILDSIADNPVVAAKLDCKFVEENNEYYKKLKDALESHPISSKLASLNIECKRIDSAFIQSLSLDACTLSFIDPFGYQNVTTKLIESVMSHWGSDCIFYCSTSGIRRNLNHASQQESLSDLLGATQLLSLKKKVKESNSSSFLKDKIILNCIKERLWENRRFYWLDLGVEFETSSGTSHFLVFLCKHHRGFAIMKDIMAKHSYKDGRGIPLWIWRNLHFNGWTQDQLPMSETLEHFKNKLVIDYSGQELSVETLVDDCHRKGYLFTVGNMKIALSDLESEKLLTVDIPSSERQKRNGIITLGNRRTIKFKSN